MVGDAFGRRYSGVSFRRHRGNGEQRRPIFWHRALAQNYRGPARTGLGGTRRPGVPRGGGVRAWRAAGRRASPGRALGAMSGPAGRSTTKLSFVDPASFTPYFSGKNSGNRQVGESVFCEGVRLADVAEKIGTPV